MPETLNRQLEELQTKNSELGGAVFQEGLTPEQQAGARIAVARSRQEQKQASERRAEQDAVALEEARQRLSNNSDTNRETIEDSGINAAQAFNQLSGRRNVIVAKSKRSRVSSGGLGKNNAKAYPDYNAENNNAQVLE